MGYLQGKYSFLYLGALYLFQSEFFYYQTKVIRMSDRLLSQFIFLKCNSRVYDWMKSGITITTASAVNVC